MKDNKSNEVEIIKEREQRNIRSGIRVGDEGERCFKGAKEKKKRRKKGKRKK